MTVLLLGANHDTATVAVRECLTIPPERIIDSLRFLKSSVGDIVLISTCNRTEFYALNPRVSEPALRNFIHGHAGIEPGEIDHALYRLEGDEAVRHLLRVSAGLDSMILGEPQILGQVRDAWKMARAAKSIGPVLDALFRTAIKTGKLARARTGISRGAVSISHAAVELARERFGTLEGQRVLVLGAGKTGALVARNLRSNGASEIVVANRTFERAIELAGSLGARAVHIEEIDTELAEIDIVITCTGASEPLLTRAFVEPIIQQRNTKPLLAIDIAMPRDVASDVAGLPGIVVNDLDHLQSRMAANTGERREAADQVQAAVEEQVHEFRSWYAGHTAGPTIQAVLTQADSIRVRQLDRVLQRLPDLNDRERETLRIFSEQLVNAILHRPIHELRDPEFGPANAGYLRTLFGLEAEHSSERQNPPQSVEKNRTVA